MIFAIQKRIFPPVAKLDIAVDSDSKGRGFKSLRAGQKETTIFARKLSFLSTLFSFHSSLFTSKIVVSSEK